MLASNLSYTTPIDEGPSGRPWQGMTQSREAANSRREKVSHIFMHYKNGTPAKIGDKILVTPSWGNPFTGIVIDANAGAETCNLQVVPYPANSHSVTASEALRLDEVGDIKPAAVAATE